MSTDSNLPTESKKIAITATFTAEPLEQALAFWMQELEMPAHIAFAPYNQVFQQLLDPSSLLAANRNGINVVLIRFEDWLRDGPDAEAQARGKIDPNQKIKRNAQDLIRAVTEAVKRSPTPYLICFCPASPSEKLDLDRESYFKDMEDWVVSKVAEIGGVHVITSAELETTYPVARYDDSYADRMAHIPFTPVFFTALGTLIARKIYALKHAQYKVIVLDCDQTLWGGLCGEDGPLGIQISPEREAIQEFMIRQHDEGMLLCLCSKNNEEDVAEVFECRSEMALRREHITTWRVNWKPKSENIRSMAEELQLGLDSFIFIDDDPVECAEVQTNCPDVLTLQLPQRSTDAPRFLNHLWIFDRLKVTDEGSERTALYRQNAQRERFRKESFTFKDFLASLGLKVQISPLAPHQLARVSELTQRTNQFNPTTVRRSEAEIQRLCRPGGAECLTVQVKDRFGDYGLVGVVIFKADSDAITVDTFLLSCRALGRGVEHRILARLGEIARERGRDRIEVPYMPTQKNRPAHDFLEGIGAEFKEPLANGFLFRFPAEFAVGVHYSPPAVERDGELSVEREALTPALAGSAADTRKKALLLSSIAEELYSAERIQTVISAQTSMQPRTKSTIVVPRTQVEKKVADLWSELLGFKRIDINDNFFELGGHSLLAMQVLSRIRETFQVELPLRLLFTSGTSEFTVAKLAETVLKEQVGQADPKEIATMLKEVEELSDDEVKALLDVETDLVQNRGSE